MFFIQMDSETECHNRREQFIPSQDCGHGFEHFRIIEIQHFTVPLESRFAVLLCSDRKIEIFKETCKLNHIIVTYSQ
jgi:hypothetical protein